MEYACFTVGQPETTPRETLEQLAGAGYTGVEWRVTNDDGDTSTPGYWKGNRTTLQATWSDEQFKEVSGWMAELNVRAASLGSYLRCDQYDDVARMMQVAKILGAQSLRVNSLQYDGSRPYPELFEECIGHFGRIQQLSKQFGVKAVLETHPGNITTSASLAFQLASNFSPQFVGIIHDAGNMVHEGYEHYQMIFEMLGPYLAHVHIKNGRWSAAPAESPYTRTWKNESAPMRDGCVDFEFLIRSLKSVGYDGWLSFEDFSDEAPQAEKVTDNIAFMKEIEQRVS